MLALLLLAQHVLGTDTSKDSVIVKRIDVCPDVGYFFKRDLSSNAIEPGCHLCFCQDNETAVCWSREKKRCDEKHYYHAGKKKRDIRTRRSPGFSDVFFRDATRDIFNKQTPQQCKPFESSFSEGCPPADWCTGCTVCDCDANGRWDCHILSFCPDSKGKKQMKKRRSRLRNKIQKRQLPKIKTSMKTTKKPTRKPMKQTQKYPPLKKNSKGIKGKNPQITQNKAKENTKKQKKPLRSKPKKYTQSKKPKAAFQKKNFSKDKTKFNKKSKSKKPIPYKANKIKDKKGKPNSLKSGKVKNINNMKNDSTVKFAQTFLKKVMASVEKIVSESQKNLVKAKQPKNIQKRSMSKNYRKEIRKNNGNRDSNKVQSKIINKINTKLRKNLSKKKSKEKLIIRSRRKREITTNDIQAENNTYMYLTTIANTTNNYYNYKVDLKNVNITKHNNSMTTERNYVLSTLNKIMNRRLEIMSTPNNFNSNKLQNLSNLFFNTDKNHQEIFRAKSNCNNNGSYLCSNNTNYKGNLPCAKFCDVKKTFRKYVSVFNKINSTKTKLEDLYILSNLKKIFKKIFIKTKVNSRNLTIEKVPFRKRNIIRILCKNIDSCKVKHSNNELQLKLEKLRAESLLILKSARIIKGLLRLLNNCDGAINGTYISRHFTDNDIKKLNLIITDEFYAKYGLLNVTETQRTQIKYIKENTYMFIHSIEKFVCILNDIMNILANKNRRVVENSYRRCARNYTEIKVNRNDFVSNKLEKLKNLLIKYNLVHNKFMKRMYDVLITLENNGKNKTDQLIVNKVSAHNEKTNYTVEIENYTKNIFDNLRKLKDLAVRLNSKNRKKRAIMEDDDAIEYLLRLMEYLFKQNKPLDIPPVNDGIDLLIEAIKNSPDIKPIQKKVLNNDLIQMRETDIDITSRAHDEIAVATNTSSNLLEHQFKTFESIDEEHEELNKTIITNLNGNFNQDENDIDVVNKELKSNETENNNLDEKLLSVDKDVKKYEIFIDDTDEEESFPDTTTTVVETEAPITEPTRTFSPNKKEIKSYDSKNRVKLDWVEENSNDDEREKSTQPKETTTEIIQIATRTVKVNDKYADPISSMSLEEDVRRFKNKAEDDSYKRQMNLLNSIDYGTDKTFVDSESKEDKYNMESFPL
ncbi:unnamed protein product [Euphydryas editha]|uniref:Uncharacterized protein n=1 Tax=Euphydryas editha TaxID=104508 RepID=A0AAU9UDX8_EUPED|nr:unnamed protein product [Euphydryas editha]